MVAKGLPHEGARLDRPVGDQPAGFPAERSAPETAGEAVRMAAEASSNTHQAQSRGKPAGRTEEIMELREGSYRENRSPSGFQYDAVAGVSGSKVIERLIHLGEGEVFGYGLDPMAGAEVEHLGDPRRAADR